MNSSTKTKTLLSLIDMYPRVLRCSALLKFSVHLLVVVYGHNIDLTVTKSCLLGKLKLIFCAHLEVIQCGANKTWH